MMIKKSDLTGAQRLVKLYIRLAAGEIISPSAYAKEIGVRRQAVYRQLNLLSQCDVPVVNVARGKWMLAEFQDKFYASADYN